MRLLIGACLVALTSGGAFANVGPRTTVEYQYEVRAMGAKVGAATLKIGKFQKVGKRTLRPVTLKANTSGFGATVYPSNTTSTSWVDAAWLPIKADWKAVTPKGKRHLKANYRGKRATGTYAREGQKDYKTNYALKLRPLDLVSLFAMIPNSRLKAGQKFSMPLYDGWRVFDLTVSVGKPIAIKVPVGKGKRKALPVVIVAKRGKLTRRVVFWVDARTQEPLKLTFNFGMLGAVEAVLVKVKRRS